MTTFRSRGGRPKSFGFLDDAVKDAWEQWVAFWFAPTDPAPLGLLRLLVGGMLVYSHLVWGLNLPAFLGPNGWNSEELVREFQKQQWKLSFWWLVPEAEMQTVHRACIAILVLFWFGCGTRLTSILSFMIHISYCQRAPLSNYGLDQILGILTMYLMIGPAGAVYSVDSLWNRFRRWRRASTRNTIRPDASPVRSRSAGLALRLIQVHYCVIYFFAATAKLQGETWWTGEALWQVFANYEYQSVDLTWLALFPELGQLMTHVTLLWELSFAYLIWVRRLRPVMLILGTGMHLGIGAFLGMWTFGLAMIFGYVAFLKPATVRKILCWPFNSPRGLN